jgi:hypothetical protein
MGMSGGLASITQWTIYPHSSKALLLSMDTRTRKSMDQPGNFDILCLNPGSVGVPKDGAYSYGIYKSGVFKHCLLETE